MWKSLLTEWKDNPQTWRKYLQNTNQLKDHGPKYKKRSHKLKKSQSAKLKSRQNIWIDSHKGRYNDNNLYVKVY